MSEAPHLRKWSKITPTDYIGGMCIHELFETWVKKTPDVVAVIAEDSSTLTYEELNRRANQVAHYLHALGVGPGILVGICLERSLTIAVGLLGILKAGGAYVPLDPTYPMERLAFLMENSGVKVVLTQERQKERFSEQKAQYIYLDTDWLKIAQESIKNPRSDVKTADLAYVIYTSGSAGKPKGVMIEHQNVLALLHGFELTAQSDQHLVGTLVCPIGFDVSVWEIFSILCFGGTLHILSYETSTDPERFAHYLVDHNITNAYIPPALLSGIADQFDTKTRKIVLERILVGVEPIAQSILQRFRTLSHQLQIVNGYGPTETTVCATFFSFHFAIQLDERTPIGSAVPGYEVYVVDQHLYPVPAGTIGEIVIAGAGLGRGYLHDPALTAQKFVAHPFSNTPGNRLYLTGDQGRYLSDGTIIFVGRADTQVKIRGFRIELGEVETALQGHPKIQQAIVIAQKDARMENRLVAYVVSSQKYPSSSELLEFLKEKIPTYMLPSLFVMLDRMPLTPHGKVNRQALPAPTGARPDLENEFMASRTPVEEILVGIWTDILGLERVGIYDNFFELGGHSLLATQLISRVRTTFHVVIRLYALFTAPTIVDLAKLIEEESLRENILQLSSIQPASQSRDSCFPLSFSQERVWFIQQLNPENISYNFQATLRLNGTLDISVLEESLSTIVRRHEILRTTFPAIDGRPVQVIHPPWPVHLTAVNIHPSLSSELEVDLQRQIDEAIQKPFDPTQLPLIRWTLLQLSTQEYVFIHVEHHLLHDGWSFTVFLRELMELYKSFTGGNASTLPELPIQFADFAVWQRRWLQEEPMAEAQLQYWKKKLAGSSPLLELPTDHPRPMMASFRGATLRVELSPLLCKSLRALSHREGVTLFMTLLAAFNILLYRYTYQGDLQIGASIANRRWSETEDLIGMFINTVVLRTAMSSTLTFQEYLKQVRNITLEAYEHQEIPFEKLVKELQPERDLSRNPLFQVTFNFHDAPMPNLELPELSVQLLEGLSNGSAKFDLSVIAIPRAEQHVGINQRVQTESITFLWEYNTDLFEEATIQRLLSHYQRVLEGIVAHPEQCLCELPLLSSVERQCLLHDWNATQIVLPTVLTIHEQIAQQAVRTPGAIAVVFQEERLSYAHLDQRANQLAHYLQSLGVGPEVRVSVCMERSLEMVIGLLGVLKAGGAYVPMDPDYPKERLAFLLEDAQAAVVLTQQHLLGHLPDVQQPMVCLDKQWEVISQQSTKMVSSEVGADHLAYVIYTSGSTGVPKGVMITHGNVVNFFTGMDARIGVDTSGTWLAVTSISFDISVLELFWTLARGFRIVVLPEQDRIITMSETSSDQQEREMAFSLFYFASDDEEHVHDKYRLLIEGATFADEHGFSAVWTPERHFHAFGGLYPNPSITSAAIAAITQHVHIRAGSVVLPLHSPIRVAEEWAVVDNLSNGRVGVSFASGWHINDFVFAPENYSERKKIMFQEIETVQRLWRGETLLFSTDVGEDVGIKIVPRPIQRELPIWLTSAGNQETFRQAGEMGVNVLTHLLGQSIEELREKIAIYRDALEKHGYDSRAGQVTLMLHTFVGEDSDAVREKVRGPFCNYLRSSLDLLKNFARNLGQDIDVQDITEEDFEVLLSHAFDRYFEVSGLFGTPGTCLRKIQQLKQIGVDEVACLIDFGVDVESVLSSLRFLNTVKEQSDKRQYKQDNTYSIPAHLMKYGVTHMQCTPSMLRMLSADQETLRALKSLKKLLVGGEAFAPTLADQCYTGIPGTLHNMYGPTETTIWSTSYMVEKPGNTLSIGRPIANTEIYILDQHFQLVPLGVPGELLISGEGVARGYLNRPDKTADRFIPHPFSTKPGARLYRTGDLARYSADGTIEFLGRIDNQIKLRGFRIELGEIETLLEQHPGVSESVVVLREDTPEDKRLVAYIVLAKSHEPDASLLRYSLSLSLNEMQPIKEYQRYTLPNGMTIAHLSAHQTRAGYREIFEEEVYIRHGMVLNDGACILDIGANIGLFTLFAYQKCKNPTIYAFEPITPTFEVLHANVLLHGLSAKVFARGLSDKREEAVFTFYPQMSGLSGRFSEVEEEKREAKSIMLNQLREYASANEAMLPAESEIDDLMEKRYVSEAFVCQLITLSQIISENNLERIDFLKIDVERSEYLVLLGIHEADWPKIQQIVMEIHSREILQRVSRLLEDHGYDLIVDEFAHIEEVKEYAGVYNYMLYAVKHAEHDQRAVDKQYQPDELIVTAKKWSVSIGELRNFLLKTLPAYMLPSDFVVVDKLPLTPNGKIDRHALPTPQALHFTTETRYLAPQTQVEQTIAAIWQKVLHLNKVGIYDTFFELGGNSLLFVQVLSNLRDVFEKKLTMVQLFEYPTIHSLAEYISQVPGEKKPSQSISRAHIRRELMERRKSTAPNEPE